MHNKDIKARIFNPDLTTMISVPQFDTIKEAMEVCGEQDCLEAINQHSIRAARISWNNRIVNELLSLEKVKK